MATSVIQSRATQGMDAPSVRVEIHLSGGLPSFSIVGMPETTVKESRERVRSALLNCGFDFPARRIVVNLSPAEIPKDGGRYDLPIAIGILKATKQLEAPITECFEFYGELSLTGELREFTGSLPAFIAAKLAGRSVIIPSAEAAGAGQVNGLHYFHAPHLLKVTELLTRRAEPAVGRSIPVKQSLQTPTLDMVDVLGQHQAKRSIEIAAAGGHNLIFVGPPGTGKSMLAQRMPGIMPPLTEQQSLETASIFSLVGLRNRLSDHAPPFRSPHHSASAIALVGGGSPPKPGEISLAHNGVLFMDELPEFGRRSLEMLREPMETGHVGIARANHYLQFPAKFQLIAALNPCPCGYVGTEKARCGAVCSRASQYLAKLSGPLLDRIDLQVEMPNVSYRLLREQKAGDTSAMIRERVLLARDRQFKRQGSLNQNLHGKQLAQHCVLDAASDELLMQVVDKFALSARSVQRVLRVSRTIADLAGADRMQQSHVAEAVNYRFFDRFFQSMLAMSNA